jgi:hypothetical protein
VLLFERLHNMAIQGQQMTAELAVAVQATNQLYSYSMLAKAAAAATRSTVYF